MQIAEVFQKDGRTTPVFNDKHLSWKFEWAKEMVATAKEMNFPLLAGSSLPVTWRMPAIDLPYGAEVEEIVCVAFGGIDIYDFHALETIQSWAERRKGQHRRGDRVGQSYDRTRQTAAKIPGKMGKARAPSSSHAKDALRFHGLIRLYACRLGPV